MFIRQNLTNIPYLTLYTAMNVICEGANEEFCASLEAVDCCDFHEDGMAYVRENRVVRRFTHEYEIIDGIVYGVSGGGGVDCCGGSSTCSATDLVNVCTCRRELYCRLLLREPIQLLHDLSVQLSRLHRGGYTITDVDVGDIASIDGRFCIFNTAKLIKFDKKSCLGSLTFPPSFGNFVAPELRGIKRIPAMNVVHKNSVVWSVGMMYAKYVFGITCDCDNDNDNDNGNDSDGDSGHNNVIGCDCAHRQLNKNLYDDCLSSLAPIVRRCVSAEPESRMLIVV